MSNQDTELPSLCKEVYERTGLDGDSLSLTSEDGEMITVQDRSYWLKNSTDLFPLYTSDYLLEKLPKTVKNAFDNEYNYLILYYKSGWIADYIGGFIIQKSDTPLKALLKLTIALHKAGELK